MTNNALVTFTFEGQADIRVVRGEDGEPRFVAADVCKALGISDVKQAIERLDDDERGRCTVPTGGGIQSVLCVTESGLYSLILTSRKPEAKTFKRWITHEVLPSIRKTGQYGLQNLTPAQQLLIAAQQLVDHERQLAEHDARLARLEAEQQAADNPIEYFTIIGYCKYKGLPAPTEAEAIALGKRAAKLSRSLDRHIGNVPHRIHGYVHTYHISILEQVVKS